MQFTLSKMFISVTMLAIACTGMTYCSRWWAHGIFTFSVLLYTVMAIRAIASEGQTRASSFAFALVGGGYLLLTACGIFSSMRDMLPTNQALIAVGKVWHAPHRMVTATWTTRDGQTHQFQGFADELGKSVPQDATNLATNWYQRNEWPDEYDEHKIFTPLIPEHAFILIGHCALSWIFAVFASWLASWMYARREIPKPT